MSLPLVPSLEPTAIDAAMTTAATTSSNSTHLPPLHGIRSFPSLPNTELATTTMHTVQPSMESTLVHSTTDIITNTTTDIITNTTATNMTDTITNITAADITTNPITNPISVNTPNYSGLAAGAIKPRQQSLIMGTGSPLIELHDINLQSRPRTPLSSSSVAKVAQDTTTTTHAATIIEPKNMPADTFTTPDDLDVKPSLNPAGMAAILQDTSQIHKEQQPTIPTTTTITNILPPPPPTLS
ncbi:hypothetical protein BASA50_008159 [Batrachochytrium salamandrivorans]|uniref:Uncharacterized protein n=1 Tax=Batrachochytrium salamandrivorans TaxID=1357716 RepID=A0ABQ8F4Z5_9FUNG|nr:hypothetical protein BASA50_008159 [Batrachochytrium salamandrivorans]